RDHHQNYSQTLRRRSASLGFFSEQVLDNWGREAEAARADVVGEPMNRPANACSGGLVTRSRLVFTYPLAHGSFCALNAFAGVLVRELDKRFVPAVEAAVGPAPEWYKPESRTG